MKAFKFNILNFMLILLSFSSCTENKENQYKNGENTIKPIISEYKSEIDEYNSDHFLGTKLLYVKKLISPQTTKYIYKYEHINRIDSLVFFKDSVKLNNKKLLILSQKTFKYKRKEIQIKKYQYVHNHLSNYFISDSLGLIIEHGATHPFGSVIRKYAPTENKELCDKIISDSIFFSLKFDFN